MAERKEILGEYLRHMAELLAYADASRGKEPVTAVREALYEIGAAAGIEKPLSLVIEGVRAGHTAGAAAWKRDHPEKDDTGPLSVDSFFDATVARLRARARGEENPIGMPWLKLGEALSGGLWPGEAYALVGTTGSGKSQFALQCAVRAAQEGAGVLYVSLELGHLGILARLLSLVGNEQAAYWSDLVTGHASEKRLEALISEHGQALRELPLSVELGGPYGWSYDKLRTRVAAMREEQPDKPLLAVLDYAQLVSSPADADRDEARQRIQQAAYAARTVARDFNVAVLLVSSAARHSYEVLSVKHGEQPEHPAAFEGTAKESGEVEYAMDNLLAIAREQRSKSGTPSSKAWVVVAKQRHGPKATVPMLFDWGVFSEPADGDDDIIPGGGR